MQVLQSIAEAIGHFAVLKLKAKYFGDGLKMVRPLILCLTASTTLVMGQPSLAGEPLTGAVTKNARQAHGHSLFGGSSSEAKHRSWDKGPLLLNPLENTVVDTPFCAVRVDMGSVTLIVVTDKELAVYNLHDTHKDAVAIQLSSGPVYVSPERVAVLAKPSLKTFQEANPAPYVAYRQLTSKELTDNMKLYQADFDFTSLARGIPALAKIMTGNARGMLKTAAIMTQVSQSSDPYGYYVTDRVRALSAAGSK